MKPGRSTEPASDGDAFAPAAFTTAAQLPANPRAGFPGLGSKTRPEIRPARPARLNRRRNNPEHSERLVHSGQLTPGRAHMFPVGSVTA
jgi:hypothetical protein